MVITVSLWFTPQILCSKQSAPRPTVIELTREICAVMFVYLHEKLPIFFSDFNKIWNTSNKFIQVLSRKLYKNPFFGYPVVPFGHLV